MATPDFPKLLGSFRAIVKGQRCLLLAREPGGSWTILAGLGPSPAPLPADCPLSLEVLDFCWKSQESLLSGNLASDPKLGSTTLLLSEIRSLLCVPMLDPARRSQALFYADHPQPDAYSYTDQLRVEQLLRSLQPEELRPRARPRPAPAPAPTPPARTPQGPKARLRPEEMRSLYRMLSTYLGSGIGLGQALASLAEAGESVPLRHTYGAASQSLLRGQTLSSSLAQAAELPQQHLALLRVGENSGSLDRILDRLAEHVEKVCSQSGKIRSALIYPAFLMVGSFSLAIAAPIALLKPQMEMLAQQGAELPWLTQALLGVARGLLYPPCWLLGAGLLAAARVAIPRWLRSSACQSGALALPGLGRLLRRTSELELARSLAISLDSGIGLLTAVKSSLEACSLPILRQESPEVLAALQEGEELGQALSRSRVLSPEFCALVKVGEETGKVSSTLRWVADFCEMELDAAIAGLVALLEPLILLGSGLLVGLVVVATLLPSLKLLDSL